MTEPEWLAHLDIFTTQDLSVDSVRGVIDATVRRINTIIIGHANREHDDVQQLARRLDALHARLRELEQRYDQSQTRAGGEDADGTRSD